MFRKTHANRTLEIGWQKEKHVLNCAINDVYKFNVCEWLNGENVTQALDLRFWIINWPDGNRPSLFLSNIILWLRLMRMAIATNVWRYLVSWYTQSCQRTIFMIHTDVDRWQIGHWFNLSYHFDVTQQIIIPVFGVILDFRIAPKSVNVITHSKKKR